MKFKTVFTGILAVVLLGAATAQAQTTAPPRRPGGVAPKPRQTATGTGMKDGLTMEKGRVLLTEMGITNPLVADRKLINGVTVSPTGLVTATDGTTTQMNEGDVASLTGRITTRASIVEADSLLKIKTFDMRYPGKRKKMAEEAERKAKAKAKREEQKAKAKAKRG
ncbi:MAG TPA: DUF6799 domain-containing protein [Hymenobacter sp.]|jgi:hypothetical protein